jgi:hypothetical protein
MAQTDLEMLTQCANFTLRHTSQAEREVFEELKTSGAIRLVMALRRPYSWAPCGDSERSRFRSVEPPRPSSRGCISSRAMGRATTFGSLKVLAAAFAIFLCSTALLRLGQGDVARHRLDLRCRGARRRQLRARGLAQTVSAVVAHLSVRTHDRFKSGLAAPTGEAVAKRRRAGEGSARSTGRSVWLSNAGQPAECLFLSSSARRRPKPLYGAIFVKGVPRRVYPFSCPSVSLFDLGSPFLHPDPRWMAPARAGAVKDGA